MEYRRLGKADLTVSTLSFGTWAIGGSWGAVKDQEAREGIARAVDWGVTLFDTADVYGDGHAEELLGAETRHLADRVASPRNLGGPGTGKLRLITRPLLSALFVRAVSDGCSGIGSTYIRFTARRRG